MRSSRRNLLLGCGALLVLGLCVIVVLTFSGVGALAAIFGPEPQGLTVDIAIEPARVTPGDAFELVVTAGNQGSRPLEVTGVGLPQSLLTAASLTGVSPPDQGRTRIGDSTTFDFSHVVEPGRQVQFTFQLEALAAGDFDGDLEIIVGLRRKFSPLRLVIAPAQATPLPPQAQVTPSTLNIPYQAVVQIIALVEENGQLTEGWTGSGSIITSDGLILTNAHVVLSDKYFQVESLVVAITEREDQPPAPAFYAEVLQADEDLDIAVIRITTDLDGQAMDPEEMDLPVVPLGDSNQLRLGDRMYILGYPGIGGETITLTAGEVSGFTAEGGRGERAFIKTSATIAGGNSGGLAANARGELIGVPTQLGYGGDDQFIDCRVLADTNRDGVIDDEDNCVPTGGFINALRPLELAIPLIEAAQRGEVAIHQGPREEIELQPQGGGTLLEDDFSDPNSGWDVVEDPDFSVGYQDGEYHIALQTDNYFVWSVVGETLEDVVISVDALPVSPTNEGDYGLLCRYQDGDNFYALEVSEDGFYTIWKREAGEFVPLVDWEASPELEGGPTTLRLTAACVGDSLSLAVGDVLLAEARDSTFSSGDLGLIAGTWETPGLVVAFDNFAVHGP